ncbi:M13-type metalloendopeptidase [Paenibacillus paeoniae]|uniref:Peptidase M13 C-terminal domain-containing protein n=1 Tax=Paenibacillus paeoniae TaxID=2292705 RepID=A0A371PHT4_9BACL|nr:hypothetical protein DX130_01495 [Paenibacillus paeoniae]
MLIDPNPPSKVRANVVVANTDDFYTIFDIQAGDAMYIAPKNRISLW